MTDRPLALTSARIALQDRSRGQSRISREGLARLIHSLVLLRHPPGRIIVPWAKQQVQRLRAVQRRRQQQQRPTETSALDREARELEDEALFRALDEAIESLDTIAASARGGRGERSAPSDLLPEASSSASSPPPGSSNVVDASPLLRRLQGQLRSLAEVRQPAGSQTTRRPQPLKDVSPFSEAGPLSPTDALAPIIGPGSGSGSSGSSRPGDALAQLLGFKLLSAKFGKVAAFAVSIHVMRSAYQVHLMKASVAPVATAKRI